MRTDDSIFMTGALGAALGAAFGFFEQGLQDPRERHVLKYAVLGGLGFAAFAALKAGHDRQRALVGAGMMPATGCPTGTYWSDYYGRCMPNIPPPPAWP